MKLEELVIASHNQGKIAEIRQMLLPYNVKVIAAAELGLPDVEETGQTFMENAALKAEELSNICQKPCLADDSGLCVDALNGRPGVYSARYAEVALPDGLIRRDFDGAMVRLIQELKDTQNSDWSAHFSCVLALKLPNQKCRFF